jgi:hypothetical protein
LSDIADIAQISRDSNPYRTAFEAVATQVFLAKIIRQTPKCAPTLELLRVFGDHSLSNLGKLACRHMIRLIEAFRPGDSLPLEISIPPAAAVNPNTLRPETAEELRADPTINRESIPASPRRDATPPTEHPPPPVCGAMAQALAGLASVNAVPEAQRPTLLTIFQHECAVQIEKEKRAVEKEKQAVEKEKQVTADKEKAAMIEETKKIEATTKLLSLPNANLLRCLDVRTARSSLSPISLEEMARDAHQGPLHISGRRAGPARRRIGDNVFVNSPSLVDDGEIVISSAHPDRPLRFTRRETSVRKILEEEVSRMQAEDQVRPEGVPPQDVEVPVRPEGTAAADVSVVSKPFRSVAREILRSVHRRAAGAGGKGDRRWHQVIKSTTMPVKDLAALAAQNPGIVFLGEFDKNTVLKARLREYGQTPQDAATVAVLALVRTKRSRRTLQARIYRATKTS